MLPPPRLDDIVKLAILWLMLPLCLQNITICLGNAVTGSKKCVLSFLNRKYGGLLKKLVMLGPIFLKMVQSLPGQDLD